MASRSASSRSERASLSCTHFSRQFAAGAVIAPDTIARARGRGLDARKLLAGHDSYSLFERIDDLVKTGPTRTNVNDIRAILIAGQTS